MVMNEGRRIIQISYLHKFEGDPRRRRRRRVDCLNIIHLTKSLQKMNAKLSVIFLKYSTDILDK